VSEETREKLRNRKYPKGKEHHFFGTSKSEETKNKISKSMFGKFHSDETKKKIGIASELLWTDDRKLKSSLENVGENNPFFGKKHSKESRLKMKKSKENLPDGECPHCGKVGKMFAMKRWHFDNCRLK
jgi:hypothetical protein